MEYLKDSVTVACRMDPTRREKTFYFQPGDDVVPIRPGYCDDACADERCNACAAAALKKLVAGQTSLKQ